MNEVVKVSIAGIGFVFDTGAYEELNQYLEKLEEGYKGNPDGTEIISDIEARIVELILSRQPLDVIVGRPLISEIIGQMGTPDDLEAAPGPKDSAMPAEAAGNNFPRRLYRNMEGAKLGGVCNGFATYMDVDPVGIRLGMFVPLFLLIVLPTIRFNYLNGFLGALFGAFVLLYFVMWMVVPKAKTPRQRLEMQGKKITVSSIEQNTVRETLGHAADERSVSILARLFQLLGQLLIFGIKLVAVIIGFALAVAAIALLIAMAALIFDKDKNALLIFEGFAGVSPGVFDVMVIGVVLIALIILVYQIIRIVFNLRNNSTLMWILGGAWLFLTVYTGAIAVRNSDKVRDNVEYLWESDSWFYKR